MFDLTGKVAIVTGGNGGIGLGIARGLVQAGASVAIVARNETKTAAATSWLNEPRPGAALGLTADVSDQAQIERAVADTVSHFGHLNILVNNAGIGIRKRPDEYTRAEFERVVTTNLTATFLGCQAAYPELKRVGGGKIVNIGSMASLFGHGFSAPYAAAKGGVVQLTRSLAIAWAADRVQVNCILPGWFETEMTDAARAYMPELYERVLARTPAGRWGAPSDLAGTAVYLCSSASDYVTGVSIPVDGGYAIQMP